MKEILPGWRRTPALTVPAVQHGMTYAFEVQKEHLQEAGATVGATVPTPISSGDRQWVSDKLGSPTKLRTGLDKADIEALFETSKAMPENGLQPVPPPPTGIAISATAFDRGVLVTKAAAEKHQEALLMEQTTKNLLDDNGFSQFQTQLRNARASLLPAAAPLSSVLSASPATDPHLLLPGPQRGMSATVRQPAVRDYSLLTEPAPADTAGGVDEAPVPPVVLDESTAKKQKQVEQRNAWMS